MPWRGPAYPGELPTLGYEVIDWMIGMLAAPDLADYTPFVPTREQAQFILALYAIDPTTGKRRYRRAVYSRSKGAGKSPLVAALAAAEALGPVLPAGWDAAGEPVGRAWADVRTPWVQLAAVSEDQTRNSWTPLLEMLRNGPAIDEYPGLEPMASFCNLPRGRIEFVTSSPTSREGNRPVFAAFDQTESWYPSNGGVELAATIRRNLGKTGGTSVESPNAYRPNRDSVAEQSAAYAKRIAEGKARDDGLLYDHREAPPTTDMSDMDSLLAGLEVAYGDSADVRGGWVDLKRIAAEIWDPATDPQDSRAYYLNQITHAADSWLTGPQWNACADAAKVVGSAEPITLGFDGSRRRSRGIVDATALVGCRVSDGHVFQLGVWEQPDGPTGVGWEVPREQVDALVRESFSRYRVVGFYADPARWEDHVMRWEAEFGSQLRVRATRLHPIEWWMAGGRSVQTVRAIERFETAVVNRQLTHCGSYALTRHALNARKQPSRSGMQIRKPHPESPDKIDLVVAATLAYEARADAVTAGVSGEPVAMGGWTF